MSFSALRPRIGANQTPYFFGEQVVLQPPVRRDVQPQRFRVFAKVFEGLFGRYDAQPDLSRDAAAIASQGKKPFYHYHEGDLLTPGTQNFVFEPTTELTPLTTIWGNAFLSRPNAFPLTSPPQIYSDYQKYLNGIGGLVAGQIATQPLASNTQAG